MDQKRLKTGIRSSASFVFVLKQDTQPSYLSSEQYLHIKQLYTIFITVNSKAIFTGIVKTCFLNYNSYNFIPQLSWRQGDLKEKMGRMYAPLSSTCHKMLFIPAIFNRNIMTSLSPTLKSAQYRQILMFTGSN